MPASRAGRRPAGAVRRALDGIGRRPRKRLGQHFLANPATARHIVELARLAPTDRVVEVGPGLGALSDVLADRAAELWLIEVDPDLATRLQDRYADRPHVHVVQADVLQVDFAALLETRTPAVVVANLPYNIATAVLAALLRQHACFTRLVLMLQREVVDRLRAAPGGKDYAALSVFTQLAARLRPGMRVGPQAFVPRPKVESEVIVIEPYAEPPVDIVDRNVFTNLVRTVFTQRRKQLANSLRPLCADPTAMLHAAHIDPTRRPETLSLAEFATLSNVLSRRAQSTEPRAQRTDPGKPQNTDACDPFLRVCVLASGFCALCSVLFC